MSMQRSGPPSCSGRRSLLAAALGPGAEAFAPGGVAAEQQRVWAAGGLRVLLLAASPVPVSPPADPTSAPSYTPEDLTPLALVAMRDEPPTARPGHAADPRRRGDRPEDHLRRRPADRCRSRPCRPGSGRPCNLVTGPELDDVRPRARRGAPGPAPSSGGPRRHTRSAWSPPCGRPAGMSRWSATGRTTPCRSRGPIWGSRWSPGRR